MAKKLHRAAVLLVGISAPAGMATLLLLDAKNAPSSVNTGFADRAGLGEEGALHGISTLLFPSLVDPIGGSAFGSADGAIPVESFDASSRPDCLADDPELADLGFTCAGLSNGKRRSAFGGVGFGASIAFTQPDGRGKFHPVTTGGGHPGNREGGGVADGDLLVPAPIPEPGIWATLIAGFGLVGAAVRIRNRRHAVDPASAEASVITPDSRSKPSAP